MNGKSNTRSPDVESFQFSHHVNSRFFTAARASTIRAHYDGNPR